MSEIFISYARADRAHAESIADALTALGYEVWRDDRLPAHRPYADVIDERLRAAAAVVVIWSKDAAASQWVRAEADVARQAAKLVQVAVDATPPPLPFNQIHCADLSGWRDDPQSRQWRTVLDSLAELTGGAGAATAAPGERPALAQPRKPSIAVLPFKNIRGDSEQDYLVDAISEDIVTALCRWHWFFVIASNSSFTYRDRDIDPSRVGRELGVRYVLEGSVRRIADRIRLSAQLVDTADGSHVWAEKYDRGLADILALPDEITEQVVAAIEPAMLHREGARVARKSLTDYSALDCFYRGMWQLNKVSRPGYAQALSLFQEAIRRDPELSLGHIGLARILFGGAVFGWSARPLDDLEHARAAAQTAIGLDGRDACAYFAAAGASLYLGNHGAALVEARQATNINSNFAHGHMRLGQVLVFSGRPAEAIEPIERCIRLSPCDPQFGVMLESLALAHFHAGDYDQAITQATTAMHWSHADGSMLLAASFAEAGRLEDAAKALPRARWAEASPQQPMAAPYADPDRRERLRQAIRMARRGGPP